MLSRARELARKYVDISGILTDLRTKFIRIGPMLRWPCLMLATALFAAELAAPTVTGKLDPHRISAEQGAAFIAQIPTSAARIYSIHGDSTGGRRSGPMILAEDGLPLGPEGVPHDQIRASGAGAYSHWEGSLYFSSSDGSDPRSNGRSYTFSVGATLKPKVKNLGILAGFLGLLCLSMSHQGTHRSQAPSIRRLGTTRLLGVALTGAGVVLACALVAVPSVRSPERIRLNLEGIQHAGDLAYYAALSSDHRWPWQRANALTSPFVRSTPQLIEDGVPIGRPTLSVGVVRKGEGRFAYFDDAIAFSSSDGSDPRANGRHYDFEVGAEPSRSSWFAVLGIVAVGLIMALWGRTRRFMNAGSNFASGLPSDITPNRTRVHAAFIDYLLIVLLPIGAIALLLFNWWTGSTSHLGVASYLPVSDAFGYYQCALSIGLLDTLNAPWFGVEWCSRRALYPSMLSSLLALSEWRPSVVLVVQAGMIGMAASILLLTLHRSFGWIVALLCTAGVSCFAYEFALGNFMTESLGLAAGLCGFSLILLSVRRKEPIPFLLVCGLGMVSIGMAVRVGAIFAIPILALWTLYASRGMGWYSRWRLLALAAGALAAGLVLHVLVAHAQGASVRNTGGNSAVVLYGLSTGSRDWSQAHRDFAGDFASTPETIVYEKIRGIALTNIRNKPEVFVGSLIAGGAAFGKNLFSFGPLGQYNGLITLAFALGLLACLVYWRNRAFALLLAFAMAEIVAAPFIFDSGGQRVFAVTVAARLAIAALGIAWIVAAVLRLGVPAFGDGPALATDRRIRYPAGALSAALAFLAVFSTTPLADRFRLKPVTTSGSCGKEELEVVTRLGTESMQLTLGGNGLPLRGERLGVQYGRLELDPASRNTWWLGELKPQPYGTTLIYAVQRTGPNVGMILPTFAQSPLQADGELVSLCLMREPPGTVILGDMKFLRLVRSHRHEAPGTFR